MISKSYPYLDIARKYGVDYGQVLRCADRIRRKEAIPEFYHFGAFLIKDIKEAIRHSNDVQAGRVAFPPT